MALSAVVVLSLSGCAGGGLGYGPQYYGGSGYSSYDRAYGYGSPYGSYGGGSRRGAAIGGHREH